MVLAEPSRGNGAKIGRTSYTLVLKHKVSTYLHTPDKSSFEQNSFIQEAGDSLTKSFTYLKYGFYEKSLRKDAPLIS